MAAVVHEKGTAKKQSHAKVKLKAGPVKARARCAKPDVVGDLRHRLQLNQAVFARLLPVSLRSLATLVRDLGPPIRTNDATNTDHAVADVGAMFCSNRIMGGPKFPAWERTPAKLCFECYLKMKINGVCRLIVVPRSSSPFLRGL